MIDLSKFLSGAEPSREDIQKSEGSIEPPSTEIPPALREIPVRSVDVTPESRIVVYSEPHGLGADRYRYLRLRLREYRKSRKLQTVIITSPLPLDGKSTTTLNLATSLADGGRRTVLCIEADLHHPSLAATLGIEARRGLADCIHEDSDPVADIMRVEPLGWYLLPSGLWEGSPTELLQSDGLQHVLDKLTAHFDWIILDTPPILALTDTVLLSTHVDGTLLVARAHKTPRESVEEALRLIGKKKIVGVVLNSADDLERAYGKYYSSYYRDRTKS